MNQLHPIAGQCSQTLQQLKDVISELNREEYSLKLPILHHNSIGMHVRHVIEFYHCLMLGLAELKVDYDARIRNVLLENDVNEAIHAIDKILGWLQYNNEDIPLHLIVHSNETFELNTNLFRELSYNQEHCIHHMAIIRICIEQVFPEKKISESFGVAQSTLKYRHVLGKFSS